MNAAAFALCLVLAVALVSAQGNQQAQVIPIKDSNVDGIISKLNEDGIIALFVNLNTQNKIARKIVSHLNEVAPQVPFMPIALIDCQKHADAAAKVGFSTVPEYAEAFLYYKGIKHPFPGQILGQDVVEIMMQVYRGEPIELTNSNYKLITQGLEPVYIMYLPEEHPEIEAGFNLAAKFAYMTQFTIVRDTKLARRMRLKPKPTGAQLHLKQPFQAPKKAVIPGSLEEWLNAILKVPLPPVKAITKSNFQSHLMGQEEFFMHIDDGLTTANLKALFKAARSFPRPVPIFQVAAAEFTELMQKLKVRDVPALVAVRVTEGEQGEFVFQPEADFVAELDTWIASYFAGTIKNKIRSLPIPPPSNTAVQPVVRDSWDSTLDELEDGGALIIKIFAEWCGHCKHLAPIFLEAAQEAQLINPKLKFIEYDGDQNDLITGMEITGFPTVLKLKKGSSKFETFTGARTKEGVLEWALQ